MSDDLTIYGDGSFGGRVGTGYPNGALGYLDEHELATPKRLDNLRRHGIPEAPIEDFEIRQTGAAAEQVSFIDKATGREYRLGPDPTLQALGASDVVAFVVDGNNRLRYLRPRGPKPPSQVIDGEPFSGRVESFSGRVAR
jgi:hypothetical protein